MSSSKDPESQLLASKLEKKPLLSDEGIIIDENNRSSLVDNNSNSNINIIDEGDDHNKSILHDSKDTILLGIPIFLSMLSWVGMKTTDSALLGHVNADALSAAALADLWTMCTSVLINARILGVLCSNAVGAGNPKLAGVYLQVSLYVLSYIVIFVFICWYCTGLVWTWMGTQDTHLVQMANYYARILAWSLPGQLLMTQISQFFTAQRIMHPEVNASAVALVLNLLLGLFFVLGIPIPNWSGFGFPACPVVTSTVVYVQVFVLWFIYIHIQRLHEPCWGGWKWNEITIDRIKIFCDLYVPAALGMASDFWRVAVIGTIAAKLGSIEVAVFNTSYRIMWIVLIMIGALSGAAGIKTSTRLGKMDHIGAKQSSWVGIGLSACILIIIGTFVLLKIRWFGRVFTDDEKFLQLLEDAKWPFTLTLILMNMSVALERIPYSMGRTKIVFWFGLIASWGFQVPGVFFLTKYWRDDLIGLYSGMAIGYLVLTILYGAIVVLSDWKQYAELARQRSEVSDDSKS